MSSSSVKRMQCNGVSGGGSVNAVSVISSFSVVQIWTKKGMPNAVLCTDFPEYPEAFVRFSCCLLQAHFAIPRFSSAACHITGGHNLVLHIENWSLSRIFFYAVVDKETHCWRTSAIKCTLYVQRPLNTGHHTAHLDINNFIFKNIFWNVPIFNLWNEKKVKSLTLWAAVPQSWTLPVNSVSAWMCPSYSPWRKTFCCCRPSEIEALNRGWRVLDCNNKASDVCYSSCAPGLSTAEQCSSGQGSAGFGA